MKIKILVGTTHQTSMQVAQAIELEGADLASIQVQDLQGQTIDTLQDPSTVYLICSGSYGSGDVPENAQGFLASLQSTPSFLGHVRYGVIALGDQASYPNTFAQGGLQLDAALTDLGAQRLGDVLTIDVSEVTEPEAAAAQWFTQWAQQHLSAKA
jgi:MioC protein